VDAPRSDTYLITQMHALAISIYQARQRNDKADVEALLQRFNALADEYRSTGSDMTGVDNFILAVGTWIDTSVDAIPNAIAALPTAVGTGLIKAAIPFAALYLGFIFLRRMK
jgi:hypothetical protein